MRCKFSQVSLPGNRIERAVKYKVIELCFQFPHMNEEDYLQDFFCKYAHLRDYIPDLSKCGDFGLSGFQCDNVVGEVLC